MTTKKAVDARAHSELSPSSAHRWMQCPGSVSLSRGILRKTSPHAEEGTLAHALLEHLLVARLEGRVVHSLPDGYKDEMLEGALVVCNYLNELGEGIEYHPETEVSFGSLFPDGETWGTADLIIWHSGTSMLEVVDYKYGRGVVVDPEENEQLALYAIGAMVVYGYKPSSIRLTIAQPRAGGAPIRSWTTGLGWLKEFGKRVRRAAELVYSKNPPLSPSEGACRWCPAAFKCPALRELGMKQVFKDFENLDAAAASPVPGDVEELRKALDAARLLDTWVRAVEARALELALAGATFEGYKLVEGRTNRRWVDEDEVRDFFKRKRIPAKEFERRTVVGIPAAEKLFKRRSLDAGELSAYITKPPGSKRLVPITDARGGVDPEFGIEE